eukprot:m.32379 g.32379  ORF g.32379 m.32379 type:complete len:53 (+) comp14104_c0_seq1:336-494(+)
MPGAQDASFSAVASVCRVATSTAKLHGIIDLRPTISTKRRARDGGGGLLLEL